MRFSRGMWFWEDAITPVLPSEVAEFEITRSTLTAFVPQVQPKSRANSIGSPVISVRYSSPLAGVICVEATHFAGTRQRGPAFELTVQSPEVEIREESSFVTLESGGLSVRILRGEPWQAIFEAEGRELTRSGRRGLGYFRTGDGAGYMRDQLDLAVDASVYGLGERFGSLVKNGQSIEMWNEDPGTGSDLAYKNVPFYLTTKGYGVFVNSPGRVSFEVATERVSRVGFSVREESLQYLVIYGPSPREIIEKYTALTGRPSLPPAWSFGLWLTTSFTTNYDEATVMGFIQGMADRRIPLNVFHFDCFWMRACRWCDFTWDEAMFPDPAGFLKRLHDRGLKVCLWINPYIAQRSAMFEEGRASGYLLRRPNGDIWQTDDWQPGMGIVDFTNPGAVRWYGDRLRTLLAMGVDCFKTDFGERIPADVVYHDGSDPERAHNYYAYLYNKAVYKVLREVRGESEAVVFARSATAGCQQFPIHWGGDSEATYASMAETLRGGLSLGACGFGFWSHDIGGFEHTATPDLYKRWIAFGLLSSHSRLHGSQSYRVPWSFDEEASEVLRIFTSMKCVLMPYLYETAVEATRSGMPMLRAMALEFPDDPACSHLEHQYMLGPSLLVAPVLNEHGSADYYLPGGCWTNYFSGKVCEGGCWVHEEQVPYRRVPLWVRENTVLPLGANDQRPDYDYAEGLTLRCYGLRDGAEVCVRIPDLAGRQAAFFRCRRNGSRVVARRENGKGSWSIAWAGGAVASPVSQAVAVCDGEEGDVESLSKRKERLS